MRASRRDLLLAMPLVALLAAAPRAQGGAWTNDAEPVSGNLGLSRTTPSNRFAGLLADGSLYAVWYVRTGSRSAEIRGGRRPVGGTGWVPDPEPLSGGDSLASQPTLAVDSGGEGHLVWTDDRHGNNEIYYRHRLGDGSWNAEERLTTGEESSVGPVVAAGSAGRLAVVWVEGGPGNQRLQLRLRSDSGAWGPVRELTPPNGSAESPALQSDHAGQFHLVWQSSVLNPIIGVDDPGNSEIYYLRLDADGAPAITPYRVSQALGRSQHPSLAVENNGTLHVFWCDNRDRSLGSGVPFPISIWYRRSLPGLGFGHEKRFVFNGGDNLNPVAAVDAAGTVNVVWENYSGGNSDLFYRQITPDYGWDPEVTRLTNTAGATQGPGLLAEPNGTLHLLWTDLRNANELNIYYRSGSALDAPPR